MTPRSTLPVGAALSILVFLAGEAESQRSQVDGLGETVTAPFPRTYEAGWLQRALLGGLNRDLWSLRVEAPLLDLRRFAGGLAPLRRGGGLQTASLRFRGGDGQVYTFRSLDKDAARAMDPGLGGSLAATVKQDQIAALNPLSAMVVAPLLEAAGVLHADPTLVVMPDDPALGEFREDFAGILGWIEVRPDEGPDGEPGFAGSARVTGSEAFLDHLEENPNDQIEAEGYLRARLMDLFVGDWDRHPDQWRWAAFEEGDVERWMPIPRDRDWALAKIDGLLPWLSRKRWPQYVGFSPEYESVFGMMWSGRALDRQLLSGLGRADFERTAYELRTSLTDAVVDDAVGRLPSGFREVVADGLAEALRARRDGLVDAALEFYDILSGWVDVFATDEPEYADVARRSDGSLSVRVIEIKRDGSLAETPHFGRVFDPAETFEVRLFLRGAKDSLVVHGGGPTDIALHVVGGGGGDFFFDGSSGEGVHIYDDSGANVYQLAPATSLDENEYEQPPDPESATHQARARDWGARWLSSLDAGYSSDQGFYFGQSFERHRYGFRHFPYQSRIVVEYVVTPSLPGVEGGVRWDSPLNRRGLRLSLGAEGATRDPARFYGFGNETVLREERDFYRSDRGGLSAAAAVRYRPSEDLDLFVGPAVWYSESVGADTTLLTTSQPYGHPSLLQGGLRLGAEWDRRDDPLAATSGGRLTLQAQIVPAFFDTKSAYVSVAGSASVSVALGAPVLSLKAGGATVFGDAPYFDAATIGGSRTLRGFARDRFRGQHAVFGSAQLRTPVTPFFVLFPGTIGLNAALDVGRVFHDGERSDTWHAGYGGGIWISIVRPEHTGGLTIMRSEEGTRLYLRLGFPY